MRLRCSFALHDTNARWREKVRSDSLFHYVYFQPTSICVVVKIWEKLALFYATAIVHLDINRINLLYYPQKEYGLQKHVGTL